MSRFVDIRRRMEDAVEIWDFYDDDGNGNPVLVASASDREVAEQIQYGDWLVQTLKFYQLRLQVLADQGSKVVEIADEAIGAVETAGKALSEYPAGQTRSASLTKSSNELAERLKPIRVFKPFR